MISESSLLVTIFVPVYGAPVHTKACLEALAATIDEVPAAHVLVIDDATPDEGFFASVADQCRRYGFELLRNPVNLGFVGSCNRAFATIKQGHVLLLNSDTVVFAGWLKEMVGAVADGIGAVTAVSNNATIYSLPSPGIDPFSADFTPADLAEVVRSTGDADPIRVPSAVGFCMLLTRPALDAVGGFDPRYGRGYAEEDDWCMRARRKGFTHMLAPRAFVYHEGAVSMTLAGVTDVARDENQALRESLHPEYWDLFHGFLAEPDIHTLRHDVASAALRLLRSRRPLILHWLEADPFDSQAEGDEVPARALIDGLARECVALVAYPSADGYLELSWRANEMVMHRSLETSAAGFKDQPSIAWERLAVKLLELEPPDILHLHSGDPAGWSVLKAAQLCNIPAVISLGNSEDPIPIAEEIAVLPNVLVAKDPTVNQLRTLYSRLAALGSRPGPNA